MVDIRGLLALAVKSSRGKMLKKIKQRRVRPLCTWKGCQSFARYPHYGHDGGIYCELCKVHHEELERALASDHVPNILKAWALSRKRIRSDSRFVALSLTGKKRHKFFD